MTLKKPDTIECPTPQARRAQAAEKWLELTRGKNSQPCTAEKGHVCVCTHTYAQSLILAQSRELERMIRKVTSDNRICFLKKPENI